MKFKEWLRADEMRKPYRDYMARQFPDMPAAVRHELGTNTVIPNLKKMASSSPPGRINPYSPTIITHQTKGSTESDPQSTIDYRPPSPATTMDYQEPSPYASADEMMNQNEKIQKFKSANWPQSPEIITVNLDSFYPGTKETIKHLRFGFEDNIPVKRHSQRMRDQEKLMKNRGSNDMEPVMVIKRPEGFELLEGWHRVMNYLLSGAPPEVKQALTQGNMSAHEVDYNNWKPVKIKAFVGIPKDDSNAAPAA